MCVCVVVLLLVGSAIWLYLMPMPAITVKQVTVELPSAERAKILLEVELQNPLFLRLPYVKVEYAVNTRGKNFLRGDLQTQGTVPAYGKALVQIPLNVDLLQLSEIRNNTAEEHVICQLVGKIYVDLKVRKFAVPFAINKELPTAKSVLLTKKSCRILQLAPDIIKLQIELGLENKMAKGIRDVHADYQMSALDVVVGKGKLKLDDLPSNGQGIASIPLQIERAVFKKIKADNLGKKIHLLIEGAIHAQVEEKYLDIPFSVTKEMEILHEKSFDVKLKKIRIRKLSVKEKTYWAILDVKSLLPFKIQDLHIEGNIHLGEKCEAKLLNPNLTLLPNQSTSVELEITAQRGGLFELFKMLLRKKMASSNLKIKLRGTGEGGTEVTSEHEGSDNVPVESF